MEPTSAPAQIVADTIGRTVELGGRITDAAIAGETPVLWCDLLGHGSRGRPGCGIPRGATRSTARVSRAVR